VVVGGGGGGGGGGFLKFWVNKLPRMRGLNRKNKSPSDIIKAWEKKNRQNKEENSGAATARLPPKLGGLDCERMTGCYRRSAVLEKGWCQPRLGGGAGKSWCEKRGGGGSETAEHDESSCPSGGFVENCGGLGIEKHGQPGKGDDGSGGCSVLHRPVLRQRFGNHHGHGKKKRNAGGGPHRV